MGLIEKYHVVAADKEVASGQTIKEGQIVSLNSSGEVVIQDNTNRVPYGLAGDTKSTSASSMPGVGTAVLGNSGTASFQNRVSDSFDETRASGKMTVYHSGGEFATDQFASNVSSASIGAALYAVNGMLETADTQSSGVVARLTKAAGAYPSGVPGLDVNGDQALGGDNSNTYVEIKLVI
jgi:hypothetical protein